MVRERGRERERSEYGGLSVKVRGEGVSQQIDKGKTRVVRMR